MNLKTVRALFAGLLVLFLAACSNTPPSPATVTTPPSIQAPSSTIPAAIPSPSATPLPTATSTPTHTTVPSPTPTQEPTLTPTPFLPPRLALILPENIAQLQLVGEIPATGVVDVRFSPDGQRLAGASYDSSDRTGSVSMWDIASGSNLFTLAEWQGKGVPSLSFSPDGSRLATISPNVSLLIWDAQTGEQVGSMDAVFFRAAFSPDWKYLATVDYDSLTEYSTVSLLNASDSSELFTDTTKGMVMQLGFSPAGDELQAASALGPGLGTNLVRWEVPSGKMIGLNRGMSLPGYAGDGRMFVETDQEWVRVFDAHTWQQRLRVGEGNGMTVMHFPALSPDGKLLAVVDRYRLKLWGTEDGQELFSWPEQIIRLSFAPDGKLLAVWDSFGAIKLLGIPE